MEKKIRKRTSTRVDYVYSQEEEQWVERSSFLNGVREFDGNGNLLKEATYNAFGEFEELNVFEYDEKGFLVREYIHFDEQEIAETHTMENREDGKPVREMIAYQDGSEDTVTFTYNDAGNLLEEVRVDADGMVESREVYEYHNGKIIHEMVYGPEESLMAENRHSYDEQGNLTESVLWNSEDGDQGRVVHEYDEKGQRSETLRYNKSGQLIARAAYVYDDKGRVSDMEEEDQKGIKHTRFETDDKGNILLQEEVNEEGDINMRIERSYDEQGELTESTVFMDRHGQAPDVYYTVKFELEYYG